MQPLCKEVEWVLLLSGPGLYAQCDVIWDMTYETLIAAMMMMPA